MVPLFGAAYAAKGIEILYRFRPPKTLLNPLANGKIQGLFKAFECFQVIFKANLFSRTIQDVLYIQVLFKLVRTPKNICTYWVKYGQFFYLILLIFDH